MNFPILQHDSKLIRKIGLSDNTRSFYFEKPENFEFAPGQYLKLVLDIQKPDSRGILRYFTIASSPTEKYLMITTRVIESSFKKTLDSLELGARVQIKGPYGAFVFDEQNLSPKIYLAGGIGLTPFRSMVIYNRDKNLNIPMTLIATFRNRGQLVFYDELNRFQNKNIKIFFNLTPDNGRITEDTIRENAKLILDSDYFISGPEDFVDNMEKIVLRMGVAAERVKSEDFPGY